MAAPLSRRTLLVSGALAGGGLLVGGLLVPSAAAAAADAESAGGLRLSAWIALSADGTAVVTAPRAEMGQGAYTALAQMAAEEMDLPWDAVRVAHAPADPVYTNQGFLWRGVGNPPGALVQTMARSLAGFQMTGGSSSVRDGWVVMRPAGAAARAMLVEEAAGRWGVAVTECTTRLGVVSHPGSGRSLTYGQLAAAAANRKPPRNPDVKDVAAFRLVGSSAPRIDTPAKVNGSAGFGIDVRLPGMAHAAIRHAPAFGGVVAAFDRAAIEAADGVIRAVDLGDAVAVVADTWWKADTALSLAVGAGHVSFVLGATVDSAGVAAALEADLGANQGRTIVQKGDLPAALGAAGARILETEYRLPFLAHAAMEPMNCTALVDGEGCEVWTGAQSPDVVRSAAAETASVSERNVTVHNLYLGGGFGRRLEADVAGEAAAIAREVPGRAVKLLWSREEDTRHDFYRPAVLARMMGAVQPLGPLTVWRALWASGPQLSAVLERGYGFPFGLLARFIDRFETGEAIQPAYPIANMLVQWTASPTPVPTGSWRSVSNSFGAFVSEAFMDELAAEADQDPLAFRQRMLAPKPRHLAVLNLAAEKAGWGSDLGANAGRGIAIHECYGSIVAQVAEVTMGARGTVRVDRIVTAIDVGAPVNPAGLVAQVESAIVYGLTAALYGEANLHSGAVVEANFDDMQMVRMADMPLLETYLAPPGGPIGGGGEPGLPPVAPAVANAVFAVTGERVRSLPLRALGLA